VPSWGFSIKNISNGWMFSPCRRNVSNTAAVFRVDLNQQPVYYPDLWMPGCFQNLYQPTRDDCNEF
jgi:hypothetical protein